MTAVRMEAASSDRMRSQPCPEIGCGTLDPEGRSILQQKDSCILHSSFYLLARVSTPAATSLTPLMPPRITTLINILDGGIIGMFRLQT